MGTLKILAFAGSSRTGSYNKQLVKIAAAGASSAGAEVTVIDLRDFRMPLYDEDLEQSEGVPEAGRKLKALMREHQGFLIASPEYNSSISGLLKNSIDWASRAERGDEPALECFRGKVAAICSASPGGLGGLRGLVHLRAILGNVGVLVLADQIAIPGAPGAFGEDGSLKDARKQAQVLDLGRNLAVLVGKLAN